MYLDGDLGCRNVLFVRDAIIFCMKAVNLDLPTKLFLKTVENVQNATENFHCYPWMLKLYLYLNVDNKERNRKIMKPI